MTIDLPMQRITLGRTMTVAGALSGVAALALAPGALAQSGPANGGLPIASKPILKRNAANLDRMPALRRSRSYLVRTRVVTPRPTRAVGEFDSVGTVRVQAPHGSRVALGAFANIPDPDTLFRITTARIDRSRNQYVLHVRFPGSQGDPPRLRVTVAGQVASEPSPPFATAGATRQNNQGRARVNALRGQPGISVETEEVLVRPTSFRPAGAGAPWDDGFATLVFPAPPGRAAQSGYVRLVSTKDSQFTITSVGVDPRRDALVVRVTFPGAQGNSPKLRLYLPSRED
jgi:hypothetical protein